MSAARSRLSVQGEGDVFHEKTADGFSVMLTHYRSQGKEPRGPLLFLHGGSAWSNTFRVRTQNHRQSVVEFFQAAGYDVWLLDWRGGGRKEIVGQVEELGAARRHAFTLDKVVRHDIPAALRFVRKKSDDRKVHVIAHCMGGGCLAFGLGNACLRGELLPHLGNVVLSTLGLFFEAPWDGLTKVQDHLLDLVMGNNQSCLGIGPDATEEKPWPEPLEFAFEKWARSWKPSCSDPFCHRLAFMFGSPYLEANLSAGIHESLSDFFGPIPIAHYAHAAQNALRGYAAPFNAELHPLKRWESCLDLTGFENLRVGLVTGRENVLWHRESIDRMYDWLRRKLSDRQCRKCVIAGYAHQDLFWGKNAAADVFPRSWNSCNDWTGHPATLHSNLVRWMVWLACDLQEHRWNLVRGGGIELVPVHVQGVIGTKGHIVERGPYRLRARYWLACDGICRAVHGLRQTAKVV